MDIAIPRRVVRIEARFANGEPKWGTGLRLDSEWILTSQHIVEHQANGRLSKAEAVTVTLAAPAGGAPPTASATVAWCGEERLDTNDLRALDTALLRVTGLPDEPGDAIRLVPIHLPTGKCEVVGWPNVSLLNEDLIAPEEISGEFSAIDESATLLPVRLRGLEPRTDGDPARVYGGISGAPVFVQSGPYQGYLYGVIRKAPANRPDRLFAVSTPALLRRERFRQALNLRDPAPPHEKLILAARRLLAGNPSLARGLAQAAPSWQTAWEAAGEGGGVDGLIAAISQDSDLQTLLTTIEILAAGSRRADEMDDLRQWAGHLTALVAHRFVAARGRSVTRDSRGTKIPLGSPNYAEAVLAAEHGEAPLYEHRDGEPMPILRVPATELESGIRSGRRARDQIDLLADRVLSDDLATPRFLSQAELGIIEGESAQEQFETRIEAMKLALGRFCRRHGTSRKPYLLIQQHLRRNDPEGTLEAFLEYMAGRLPELEHVELHGNAKESLHLEDQLEPLWQILGIEKGDG